ncbi:DUF262 domain-containing protein [Candidatus Woesearchaeota archaeon]|nr:DUF262 domain-containing protein [Candidatus Woesearchaeota archaeon]
MANNEENWVMPEEDDDGGEDTPLEYNITSSPNDFNTKTVFDFMEKGIVKIPGFQRNYVWDIKRASKLIESIIMGLPIPQIFLYEKDKNDFLVIDGQQRLMTIYYFFKKRFPRQDKRIELRKVFDTEGKIPDRILESNSYFTDFELKLTEPVPEVDNRLDGLNYSTLEDNDRNTFDLRTIRIVIIKQSHPPDDHSAMYEIFYRLNTGGMNLNPQEIRASLYHSDFYDMLSKLNLNSKWRRLTKPEPDLHMKDIEIIVRGFGMLMENQNYKPSMVKFLNTFSQKSKTFTTQKIDYLKELFEGFLDACDNLPNKIFLTQSGQFNVSMFEAVFVAATTEPYQNEDTNVKIIDADKLNALKEDQEFSDAIQRQTTSKKNVLIRISRAREILL